MNLPTQRRYRVQRVVKGESIGNQKRRLQVTTDHSLYDVSERRPGAEEASLDDHVIGHKVIGREFNFGAVWG